MEIIKKIIQMNNIVNKGVKTLILLLLACLIASCNSMDHDLEFNQLNDEIAHLKNVDESISNEITNELLSLETELISEITKVEDFISDKLNQKVKDIDKSAFAGEIARISENYVMYSSWLKED